MLRWKGIEIGVLGGMMMMVDLCCGRWAGDGYRIASSGATRVCGMAVGGWSRRVSYKTAVR